MWGVTHEHLIALISNLKESKECKKAKMGMCPSKMNNNWEEEEEEEEEEKYKKLVDKMRLVQQEIAMLLSQREEENEAYERQVMAFTFKEAEWKRERKKLREEVKRLRKDACKVRMLGSYEKDHQEQMREERARRDEAVEKWKMLYLAIKAELDDLIQRTTLQGGGLYWKEEGEEYFMEEIQKELKSKDEAIDVLRAQVASLEEEEYKKKREVDILRQSLRIMCSKNKVASPKCGC